MKVKAAFAADDEDDDDGPGSGEDSNHALPKKTKTDTNNKFQTSTIAPNKVFKRLDTLTTTKVNLNDDEKQDILVNKNPLTMIIFRF
jgi:hypothetical protein